MARYFARYTMAGEQLDSKWFEAKDRSEARRIAIQSCPSQKMTVECFELDENENIKGRIM